MARLNKQNFNDISSYHFTDELRDAICVAYELQMPLLLTGRPGTGKTTASEAIVEVLKRETNQAVHYARFNTKSVSVYNDLFYRYNHLEHFANVQLEREKEVEEYIQYEALGKLIKEGETPAVLLIDEIDKAPRDFPNDLLDVFDGKDRIEFEVKENSGKYSQPRSDIFVVMTSNSERNLPDAFLRRCIFFYIDFPKGEVLEKILTKHLENVLTPTEYQGLEKWLHQAEGVIERKRIGTAEFITWVKWLINVDFPLSELTFGDVNGLSDSQKDKLKTSFSILAKTREDFHAILEKHGFMDMK
jgi:MoxR-like ATPase